MEIDDRMKEAVAGRRKQEFADSETILEDAKEYFAGKYELFSFLPNLGTLPPKYFQPRNRLRLTLSQSAAGGLRESRGCWAVFPGNVVIHSKSSVLIGKARLKLIRDVRGKLHRITFFEAALKRKIKTGAPELLHLCSDTIIIYGISGIPSNRTPSGRYDNCRRICPDKYHPSSFLSRPF